MTWRHNMFNPSERGSPGWLLSSLLVPVIVVMTTLGVTSGRTAVTRTTLWVSTPKSLTLGCRVALDVSGSPFDFQLCPDVSGVALTDTLNDVSRMSWQYFTSTKALCILCCTFLNLYGHLHRFCHWFSIFYCHSCHVIVPWCVYLFGPKWSINYYYY